MAMASCAECGKEISTHAVMCPHCGAPPAVALAGRESVEAVDEEAEVSAVLEGAIRAALHLPEGELAAVELGKVESIKLDEAEVTDLMALVVELGRLPNLKELRLKGAGVTDVAPLRALGELRYLYLEKNKITCAGPLCELKQLKQLWLYGNPLPREEVILLEQALPKCEVFI